MKLLKNMFEINEMPETGYENGEWFDVRKELSKRKYYHQYYLYSIAELDKLIKKVRKEV